jgi:predicted nucleotidyltransferase
MRSISSVPSEPLADLPRVPSFEGSRDVDEETFLSVLDEAVDAMEIAEVPYVVIGGVASSILGRSRWTHDIDLFLRDRNDAARGLDALGAAGFATQTTDDHWLYKGIKRDVLVDLIFKGKGDIYLDEQMLERARVCDFKGRSLKVIPPEDLIVIKAIIHDEQTPRHWYDALGIIANSQIDWEYLIRRASRGPRRILALLVYAQSNDLIVSEAAIRELSATIYDA